MKIFCSGYGLVLVLLVTGPISAQGNVQQCNDCLYAAMNCVSGCYGVGNYNDMMCEPNCNFQKDACFMEYNCDALLAAATAASGGSSSGSSGSGGSSGSSPSSGGQSQLSDEQNEFYNACLESVGVVNTVDADFFSVEEFRTQVDVWTSWDCPERLNDIGGNSPSTYVDIDGMFNSISCALCSGIVDNISVEGDFESCGCTGGANAPAIYLPTVTEKETVAYCLAAAQMVLAQCEQPKQECYDDCNIQSAQCTQTTCSAFLQQEDYWLLCSDACVPPLVSCISACEKYPSFGNTNTNFFDPSTPVGNPPAPVAVPGPSPVNGNGALPGSPAMNGNPSAGINGGIKNNMNIAMGGLLDTPINSSLSGSGTRPLFMVVAALILFLCLWLADCA